MYTFSETFVVTTRDTNCYGEELASRTDAFNTFAKARAFTKKMKAKGFDSFISYMGGAQ